MEVIPSQNFSHEYNTLVSKKFQEFGLILQFLFFFPIRVHWHPRPKDPRPSDPSQQSREECYRRVLSILSVVDPTTFNLNEVLLRWFLAWEWHDVFMEFYMIMLLTHDEKVLILLCLCFLFVNYYCPLDISNSIYFVIIVDILSDVRTGLIVLSVREGFMELCWYFQAFQHKGQETGTNTIFSFWWWWWYG